MAVDPKYLSDAAHFPGGHAAGLETPRTLAEIPDIVRQARSVLPIGAQSSLTGGATPMGELLLSTERLTRVIEVGAGHATVEAGVSIAALQDALAGGGAGLRVLALEGAVPVEGGVPLVADGKIIGAVGVSGDTSDHDGVCATAGAAIIK